MHEPTEDHGAVGERVSGAYAIARELDNQIRRAVLVFGSPPPAGRDLDLLARPPEHSAVAAALEQWGFGQVGNQWATFRGVAALVELVPADAWRLPAGELAALFAEGEPIDGMQRLLRPAPHHQLLILARRYARTRGQLSARFRERIDEALSRNPNAWRLATERAGAWRSLAALRLLADSYRGGRGLGWFGARALSVAEVMGIVDGRRDAGRRAARRALRRSRRPAIVAFSGLDGAGKSSQARALQENLRRIGMASEVVWPPAKNFLFQMNPRVKGRLRGVLERIGRSPEGDGTPAPAVNADRPPTDGAEPEFPPLPTQRNAVTQFLAAIIALSQVLALRRAMPRQATSSTVLIYDRYTLDAVVYLRDRWGQGRPLRWQSWLIARLTPRPAIAYLLELDPQTAFARKRDFPIRNLRDRAVLYRELHGRLGVRSLDATRPPQELSEQIALEAWAAVARRRA